MTVLVELRCGGCEKGASLTLRRRSEVIEGQAVRIHGVVCDKCLIVTDDIEELLPAGETRDGEAREFWLTPHRVALGAEPQWIETHDPEARRRAGDPVIRVREVASGESAEPDDGNELEALLTSDVAIEALSEATRTAPYPWDADDKERLWSALAYVAARLSSTTKGGGADA